MGEIEIRTMRTRSEMRAFHLFAWEIYRNDPLWIPPLLPDRMSVTDRRKGMFFKRGEAEFFAAFRDGQMVGTICAARDGEQIEEIGRPECVFGFFESVNDPDVAGALMARVETFAREYGLTSLVGPFNLDYEDGYGVLTHGRERKPVILCGHTPEYYVDLIESLGFAPARPGNIAMAVDLETPPPQLARLRRAADIARARGRFRVRGADVKHWRDEAKRVHYLLNNSLKEAGDDELPWPIEAVESLVRPFLKIADPELVLFVDTVGQPTDKKDGPPPGPDGGPSVGWFAAVPNMNEVIEKLRGLRHVWNYLAVPFALLKRPRCLAAKSLLVLPEYHVSGAAALLFDELANRALAKRYSWIDLSLTSEGNPETPIIAERAGAVRYKRYQVYRRDVDARSLPS